MLLFAFSLKEIVLFFGLTPRQIVFYDFPWLKSYYYNAVIFIIYTISI